MTADYDEELTGLVIPDQRTGEKTRPKVNKPKGYGNCPGCQNPKVALLQQGKHWVWKAHTYRTWAGAPLECNASGIRFCDLPEKLPSMNVDPIHCPCWRKG